MIDLKALIPDRAKEFLEDERFRAYLIPGVTGVLVVLYLTFLIIPRFVDFARVSRQVKEHKDKIYLVESSIKRLDEKKKRLTLLRKEFVEYSKGLPAQKEIPEFLGEIGRAHV